MYKQYLSAFTKAPVLVTAFFIAIILPLVSLPEITNASVSNTRLDAWGTDEYAGSSWMTNDGGGVDVYSNGSQAGVWDAQNQTYDGQHPTSNSVNGVTSGVEWQCVELFNRLYLTKGWITSRWAGNGNQLYNIATLPTGFSKEDNTHTTFINPGDAITFDDGGAGHVVMVDSVSGTGTTRTVNVVSQNTQGVLWTVSWNTSTHTLTQTYLGSSYGVQGIIHAPSSSPSPSHKADLVVHDPTNNYYSLAKSTGSSFSGVGNSLSGWGAGDWVGTGDFNKDGRADLVVHDPSSNAFSVALSTGSGFSGNGTWYSGWSVGNWAGVGDVNGDGYADIVVHDGVNNEFNVLLNNHTGGFTASGTWLSGWGAGDWVGLADITGDGKADLVVHSPTSNYYSLAKSTGSSFSGVSNSLSGWGAGDWVRLGDFTGDGKADLVVHDPSSNAFLVARSTGSGFVSSGTWYSGWSIGDWGGVADVDGDGMADIIVHDSTNSKFNVLISTGSAFSASGTWLSGWGAGDWAGLGDVNGS